MKLTSDYEDKLNNILLVCIRSDKYYKMSDFFEKYKDSLLKYYNLRLLQVGECTRSDGSLTKWYPDEYVIDIETEKIPNLLMVCPEIKIKRPDKCYTCKRNIKLVITLLDRDE